MPKTDPGPHAGEGYCGQKAGWGTDHSGEGRCKMHGGNAMVKHGRYSRYMTTRLGDAIEELAEDPDPLDLTEELALARALLRRATDSDDLSDQDRMSLVSEVSKIVKRIEDVRAQNAISLKEFQRLMSEIGRIVALHVDDTETVKAIREDVRREIHL